MRAALGGVLVVVVILTAKAVISAEAGVVTDDLSVSKIDAASTGVWNLVSGKLHVPWVANFSGDNTPGQEDVIVDVGNGADGVFDAANFTRFDAAATASLVTLDTSRVYQFTQFTLPAGVTLKGSGSQPLRFRVQGDVLIEGTIDLKGGNAGAAQMPVAAANGGSACCGGGAGGSGRVTTESADGTTPSAGGGGGGIAGTTSGAGGTDGGAAGGGGNAFAGGAGQAGGAGAGGGGLAYGVNSLSTLVGGAGGGGGGGNTFTPSRGAGGGGGGGAIAFFAGGDFTVSATGLIQTVGGTGGLGGNAAGMGGGGAGGSVLIYAAGSGVDNNSAPGIDSQGGSGGNDGGGGMLNGGDGSIGVHWFGFGTGDGGFTGTGNENPAPATPVKPKVFYSTASYQVTSTAYDTGTPSPNYLSFSAETTEGAAGSTVSFEVAGSSDQFVSDDTGFVPATQITSLDGKRYLRFRATLKSASPTATPTVESIRIAFQPVFEFSIGGCARALPRALVNQRR